MSAMWMSARRSWRVARRRNWANQAKVRLTTQRWRPAFAGVSTPRRAMRGMTERARHHRRCRKTCIALSIIPRIVRRGVETTAKLGRHRWVVERTFAWFSQFRRLSIRYERRADIHVAFTKLATAIIRMNQIRRFCWAL